ncbi:hypothetical protein CAQUA_10005 [Corynebacterium aquatimens]|uniref:Uncharacterized protein n=1 Tax=Corynebacterium aquatimens TaxID=1190508 RepID=A0A931E2Z0_9CORY|nr:hypothetical protein [Corynebacterium aquatimens]WJY66688.1 hypothetical protein CAQUA_10005 [Corynebacterium aquatimens]
MSASSGGVYLEAGRGPGRCSGGGASAAVGAIHGSWFVWVQEGDPDDVDTCGGCKTSLCQVGFAEMGQRYQHRQAGGYLGWLSGGIWWQRGGGAAAVAALAVGAIHGSWFVGVQRVILTMLTLAAGAKPRYPRSASLRWGGGVSIVRWGVFGRQGGGRVGAAAVGATGLPRRWAAELGELVTGFAITSHGALDLSTISRVFSRCVASCGRAPEKSPYFCMYGRICLAA